MSPDLLAIVEFRCPSCSRWYRRYEGRLGLACAVNHPAGVCCHYGQIRIDPPGTS